MLDGLVLIRYGERDVSVRMVSGVVQFGFGVQC